MAKKVIHKVSEDVNEEKVTATLFMNGGSQAVRIPAKWKFDSETVTLTYNAKTRTICISYQDKEEAKAELIALIKSMTDEEREEIKNWAVEREVSVPKVNPDVEAFFRENN